MLSKPITKTLLLLCGLAITVLAPLPAMAQSFSIQCGVPGTISCTGSASITGGGSLNTIVVNSTGISSQITLVSGLPSQISGLDDFTPEAETFLFSCSDVTAFGTAGTFMLVDSTDDDFIVTGTALVGGLAVMGSEPIGVGLDLTIEDISVGGPDDGGVTFSAAQGNGSVSFEPNGMSGVTSLAGNFAGFGSFTSTTTPTPEPGTLLLFGSGLMGLLVVISRR